MTRFLVSGEYFHETWYLISTAWKQQTKDKLRGSMEIFCIAKEVTGGSVTPWEDHLAFWGICKTPVNHHPPNGSITMEWSGTTTTPPSPWSSPPSPPSASWWEWRGKVRWWRCRGAVWATTGQNISVCWISCRESNITFQRYSNEENWLDSPTTGWR